MKIDAYLGSSCYDAPSGAFAASEGSEVVAGAIFVENPEVILTRAEALEEVFQELRSEVAWVARCCHSYHDLVDVCAESEDDSTLTTVHDRVNARFEAVELNMLDKAPAGLSGWSLLPVSGRLVVRKP